MKRIGKASTSTQFFLLSKKEKSLLIQVQASNVHSCSYACISAGGNQCIFCLPLLFLLLTGGRAQKQTSATLRAKSDIEYIKKKKQMKVEDENQTDIYNSRH